MLAEEKEGIAFTSGITKDGWQVNVTARADSPLDAYYQLMGVIANMEDEGVIPFVSYSNRYEPPASEQTVLEAAQELGGVITDEGIQRVVDSIADDPFADPPEVELVPYLKPAGEWKTGDVQEVEVDQYTLGNGVITFYKSDNKYPEVHKHYLNEIGVKVMADAFHPDWGKFFPATDTPKDIPGGSFIIAIKGGKMRDSGAGAGNVWRNLVGARRP